MTDEALESQDNEEAIEIDDSIEEINDDLELDPEAQQLEADGEDDGEIEFVVEEGEEPSPEQTVPLTSHLNRVKKLTGKVEAVKGEAERTIEAQKAEMELLQAKLDQVQAKPQGRPNSEDFDSDAEYDSAMDEYIKLKAREELQGIVKSTQAQSVQAQQNQKLEKSILDHYERADKLKTDLKVPDYEETEDRAIELFGKDVAKFIMSGSEKSQILMYHFGKPKNEAKALYFKNLLSTEPSRGLFALADYAANLQRKSKSKRAPSPETKLNGGTMSESKDPWLQGVKMW